MVVVCLATYGPQILQFSVREKGGLEWLGHDITPFNIMISTNLFFYYGVITPDGKPFPQNKLLEYSIGIIGLDGTVDYLPFEAIVKEDKLSYGDSVLPNFFLQRAGKPLTAMYGSCRKIHDVNGGSIDALSKGDGLIAANPGNLDVRPAVLCLGGDQIYADDVHPDVNVELRSLVERIEKPDPEVVPERLPLPFKDRMFYLKKFAHFTSGEATNHLVTFAEYIAMYGLTWNIRNWRNPSIAEHFTATLPLVRRLMANTPTYMIFDDHDVTDDWNLHVRWQDTVRSTKLGKRILTNALMAFWLCQGFGNSPLRYTKAFCFIIGDAIQKRNSNYTAVQDIFLRLNVWEFATPTFPFIYFLDTRTERGHRDGVNKTDPGAPAYLKSVDSWLRTVKNLRALLNKQDKNLPLVMVATTPIFGFDFVEKLQNVASVIVGPYIFDKETWSANMDQMKLFLRIMSNSNVVILSGDVHYAFTSTIRATTFDDMNIRLAVKTYPESANVNVPLKGSRPTYTAIYNSRFLQLNSSALKNFASDFFTKKPAELTDNKQMSTVISENGSVKSYRVRGNTYEHKKTDGTYQTVLTSEVKPSLLFKQNVNNAMNSRYLGDHNLGVISIIGKEVSNYFVTHRGKDSERTWNFANDLYWE